MDRLVATLLLVLIVAVTGLGVVVWRSDQHAQEHSRTLLCMERLHATAAIGLLAPASKIDPTGRLTAMKTLNQQLKAC